MNPPANTRDTTLTRSTLSPASQAGSAIAEGTEQPDDQQESPIHDPLMAGIGLILAAPQLRVAAHLPLVRGAVVRRQSAEHGVVLVLVLRPAGVAGKAVRQLVDVPAVRVPAHPPHGAGAAGALPGRANATWSPRCSCS